MLQYTQILFEHDRIRKQAKLILIHLLIGGLLITEKKHNIKQKEKIILTLVLQLGTR
jgi:hypothetical protein